MPTCRVIIDCSLNLCYNFSEMVYMEAVFSRKLCRTVQPFTALALDQDYGR